MFLISTNSFGDNRGSKFTLGGPLMPYYRHCDNRRYVGGFDVDGQYSDLVSAISNK